MYKYILFDLDGTLTDPGIGITNSVIYSLGKFDIIENDRTRLYKFIGPPLVDSYMEYYGFDEAKAKKAVEVYREYFSIKGLYENEVYEGVPELLTKLKDIDKKIILATSKPEIFARKILEYFDLCKYFDCVAGATLDGTRMKKADVIQYALDSMQIKALNEAIMIGDRKQDIIGAKEIGLNSIGVTYGYGDCCELNGAGATYIVNTPNEILEIIK